MRETDAILGQLIPEARVVSAFQAASSQGGVHLERGAENSFRDRSVQSQSASVSSVSSVVESFGVCKGLGPLMPPASPRWDIDAL